MGVAMGNHNLSLCVSWALRVSPLKMEEVLTSTRGLSLTPTIRLQQKTALSLTLDPSPALVYHDPPNPSQSQSSRLGCGAPSVKLLLDPTPQSINP